MPDVDVRCPVVAFDLDMTLVDSVDGIVATQLQVAAELGHDLDPDVLRAQVGLPLDGVFEALPAELVAGAVARYRELYPSTGIPSTVALPGAREAARAVRAQGGRVVVVSAKIESAVRAVLDATGIEVDDVVGERFAAAKGAAIRDLGAAVMVGDHPGDMAGAHVGGAVGVGVTTGPHDAAALTAAGADLVLDDLDAFPGWLDGWLLPQRLSVLHDRLAALGSVAVAYSGGADSAFLLAAAVRALGPDRVLAVTAVSPSLPQGERDAAREVPRRLGARHVEVDTHEDEREGYRANGGDRCFFCKAELLDVVGPLSRREGMKAVATGTNADDARADFRPGIRAAAERGALTPLRDAGLTKQQVRTASRDWDLLTWDKPAAACLASRVAYGVSVTPARLARVERAETALRALLPDVRDLRVRDLGHGRARVQVDAALVDTVGVPALEAVRVAGFVDVEVDPAGFRSGSMNDALRAGA